jgi:hypothetical protein
MRQVGCAYCRTLISPARRRSTCSSSQGFGTFAAWEERLQTPADVPDHLLTMSPTRPARLGKASFLAGSGVKNPFQKRTASGKVVACLSSNPA